MNGPGKYDDVATAARLAAKAEGVILIVHNGERGSGFSVQLPASSPEEEVTEKTIAILREMADGIEAESKRAEPRDPPDAYRPWADTEAERLAALFTERGFMNDAANAAVTLELRKALRSARVMTEVPFEEDVCHVAVTLLAGDECMASVELGSRARTPDLTTVRRLVSALVEVSRDLVRKFDL